jgi:hypothetical protein
MTNKNFALIGLTIILPHVFIAAIIPLTYSINPYNTFDHKSPLSVFICFLFVVFSTFVCYKLWMSKLKRNFRINMVGAVILPLVFIPVWYFIIGGWIFWNFHTTLYVDNGSGIERKIMINNKEYHVKTLQQVTIPLGFLNIVCDDTMKRQYKVDDSYSRWVFNPGIRNKYIVKDILYGPSAFDLSGSPYRGGVVETIEKEFFEVRVHYMFEAPQEISTKLRKTHLKKTVLIREQNYDNYEYRPANKEESDKLLE